MHKAIFTAGLRTPFGKAFKGAYHETRPDDLLISLLNEQKKRNPELWNASPADLMIGCAYPEAEQGYNVARVASLGSGLNTPGMTLNRLCASSLEAAGIAASRVIAGWEDLFLVGGIESMSRIVRKGAGYSESDLVKQTSPDAYINMGETAENVANQFSNISRDQQEDFTEMSHRNADAAYNDGFYQDHVIDFKIDRDEFIRYPSSRKKMASLKPVFREDGVVTAATSSPLTDGATSGWVMSEQKAKSLGIKSGIEIVETSWGHVPPELMGMGPVASTQKLFAKHNLKATDISAWEINEAFAIQSLACMQELGLDLDASNVNSMGGALALGHPLGASGLRLLITLEKRLQRENKEGALGIATLCVGGGQGVSILVKYRKL